MKTTLAQKSTTCSPPPRKPSSRLLPWSREQRRAQRAARRTPAPGRRPFGFAATSQNRRPRFRNSPTNRFKRGFLGSGASHRSRLQHHRRRPAGPPKGPPGGGRDQAPKLAGNIAPTTLHLLSLSVSFSPALGPGAQPPVSSNQQRLEALARLNALAESSFVPRFLPRFLCPFSAFAPLFPSDRSLVTPPAGIAPRLAREGHAGGKADRLWPHLSAPRVERKVLPFASPL